MRRCLLLVMAACSGSGGTPMPDSGTPCGTDTKSPPNLVVNGGFECGDAEWSVQFGELVTVSSGAHGGTKAAQLTAASAGGGQFGYANAVVPTASGNAYCVNAWVRGTATSMRIEVLDGSTNQMFSSPVESGWLQAPPTTNLKVTPAAGAALYLRFRILNVMAGQTLLVDDVDFWESASGSCNERH
jgi:hypothetical protein